MHLLELSVLTPVHNRVEKVTESRFYPLSLTNLSLRGLHPKSHMDSV